VDTVIDDVVERCAAPFALWTAFIDADGAVGEMRGMLLIAAQRA
jgi:hypothetical protein